MKHTYRLVVNFDDTEHKNCYIDFADDTEHKNAPFVIIGEIERAKIIRMPMLQQLVLKHC